MRQAQLEPLQEDAENILTEMDTAKGQMENIKLEAEEMMKEHLTAQTVESVAEKSTQVKTCAEEISGRFQELEKSVKEENTA
jgi:hypothetical protein